MIERLTMRERGVMGFERLDWKAKLERREARFGSWEIRKLDREARELGLEARLERRGKRSA